MSLTILENFRVSSVFFRLDNLGQKNYERFMQLLILTNTYARLNTRASFVRRLSLQAAAIVNRR